MDAGKPSGYDRTTGDTHDKNQCGKKGKTTHGTQMEERTATGNTPEWDL